MYKHLFFSAWIFVKTTLLFAGVKQDTSALAESPLVLKTKSGGNIYGTLTTPSISAKGLPVALIIVGSGPTDRNGNNPFMKNDCLKQLAQQLAQNNIASLRYDKRGIGESKEAGKNEADLRFDDYVNDAQQWIELLRSEMRFSTIIVIGHSEGSLIGMMAGRKADKFISIAGAGQSADKILKEQLSKQPQMVKDLSFPIIDSLKNGKLVNNVHPMLNTLFRPTIQPYLVSWFKYDPQQEMAKLKIPILVVQGTSDLQVTLQDAERLNAANPNSKLVLIENMNHILKKVSGDTQQNLATYNNNELPVTPELIDSITSFIRRKQ